MLADKRRSSEHRVHEVLGRRAVRLDAEARKVELDDGAVLQGDAIVIATGARPRPLPGTEGLGQRDGLFTLRTLDDSLALRGAVTAVGCRPGRRHRRRFHRGRGGLHLRRPGVPRHRARGAGRPAAQRARVHARCPLRVAARSRTAWTCGPGWASARSQAGGRRTAPRTAGRLVVELDGGETFAGRRGRGGHRRACRPTDWLADSGLTVENGVVCDDRLFAADGIVAAGDVARWQWRHDGGEELIRIEHWQVAAEAGVAAARSLLAGRADAPAFTPVPVLLVRSVRHPPAGAGEPAWERRDPHRRRIARGREVRRAVRPGRTACARSWPSASPGS